MDNLKELQNFLNKCIELWRSWEWWRPEEFDGIWCHDWFLVMNLKTDDDPIDMDWYHWLFSKDSWLMEFVNWELWEQDTNIWTVTVAWKSWDITVLYLVYATMSTMSVNGKVDFFIANALLPV